MKNLLLHFKISGINKNVYKKFNLTVFLIFFSLYLYEKRMKNHKLNYHTFRPSENIVIDIYRQLNKKKVKIYELFINSSKYLNILSYAENAYKHLFL